MAYNGDTAVQSSKILKNTTILYIRMAFLMGLNLYTVRVVMKALGIEDYGIYNVVAGVVTTMSFLSQTMSISTQRFFSYAIGENKPFRLNQIYNISFSIFFILSVIIVLTCETLGLWFINTYLNIPADRMYAANWIYQCAVVSFVFTILAVPYISVILAHEDMGLYAFVGIINYLLILTLVLTLDLVSSDKLIVYGFFMFCVSFIVFLIYFFCCRIKYEECRFKLCNDKILFKEIISYSGWTLYGSIAGIANNQGNNILINIFFGPIANSARAVAFQASSALNLFCTNFFTAVRPPLIKSYANGDIEYMMSLYYSSTKLSFYMIYIICLPIYLEMEFVLKFWLPEVTIDMVVFTRLSLIYIVILSLNNPITTVIQATGNVKKYFISVESFTLLSLPLTYLFFKLGFSAKYNFLIAIYIFSAAHIVRLMILKMNMPQFTISNYFRKFVYRAAIVSLISCIPPIIFKTHLSDGMERFIIVLITSVVMTAVFAYLIGLNGAERKILSDYIQKKFKR